MDKPYKRGFWERTVDALSFGLAPEETTYAEVADQTFSAPISTTSTTITPPPRLTGAVLDPRTALGINAVYRAVSIIETSVSQLPLAVVRNGEPIAIPALISKPDVRTSQTQFLQQTAISLATNGNAFWRLHRAVEGPFESVSSIEILNPEIVYVEWVKGKKSYRYGDATFAEWQVKHLMISPQFRPGSSVVMGVGPIQACRGELQGILDVTGFAQNFYRNNGIPTGVLTTDNILAQGEGDAIRARWYEVAAAGGIQVLPNGLKFQPISLDPEKAMFHASAQKAVVDVARMFGIPANYLLAAIDGTAMTYSNMQDVDRTLIRYTLMSYATAIEDAFTELLPRGQEAKFNIDAFLRSDTKSRYEAHQIALNAGFLTVDEVRALEDLPALEAGETNSNEGDAPTN